MNILSNKSFADYKQAKKELDAIWNTFINTRDCSEIGSSKNAKKYGLNYGDKAAVIMYIIEKFYQLKNK